MAEDVQTGGLGADTSTHENFATGLIDPEANGSDTEPQEVDYLQLLKQDSIRADDLWKIDPIAFNDATRRVVVGDQNRPAIQRYEKLRELLERGERQWRKENPNSDQDTVINY